MQFGLHKCLGGCDKEAASGGGASGGGGGGASGVTKGFWGTPEFMAPEMYAEGGFGTVAAARCKATDIYSLGIVIWCIYSRKHPFDDVKKEFFPGTTADGKATREYYDILIKKAGPLLRGGARPGLEKLEPGTPTGAVAWMQRCWDSSPAARPTAEQVYAGFGEAFDTTPIPPPPSPGPLVARPAPAPGPFPGPGPSPGPGSSHDPRAYGPHHRADCAVVLHRDPSDPIASVIHPGFVRIGPGTMLTGGYRIREAHECVGSGGKLLAPL